MEEAGDMAAAGKEETAETVERRNRRSYPGGGVKENAAPGLLQARRMNFLDYPKGQPSRSAVCSGFTTT